MSSKKKLSAPPKSLDLGSLLDEVEQHCDDDNVMKFLAELMEFEKTYSYSYKPEIIEMLARHVGSET